MCTSIEVVIGIRPINSWCLLGWNEYLCAQAASFRFGRSPVLASVFGDHVLRARHHIPETHVLFPYHPPTRWNNPATLAEPKFVRQPYRGYTAIPGSCMERVSLVLFSFRQRQR